MIEKTLRIIRSGFCFLIFGLGALTIASIFLPLIAISSRCSEKRNNRSRMLIHLSWQLFVFIMSLCRLISVEVKNLEILKNLKGHVIVANHPSLIDVVILISYIPQADCVVKASLANNFFMKHIVKSLYIINSLDFDDILRKCDESLKKGNNLIIFPEGTRTIPSVKSQISRGAAHIAINSQCNILPIRINCFPAGLLKNQKWYNSSDRKLEYQLNIKPEISVKKYCVNPDERSLAARNLTDKIKESLEIL